MSATNCWTRWTRRSAPIARKWRRNREVSHYPAVPFEAGCVAAVRQATEALGYSNMPTVSGAGHDAVYVARLAPAGMIFVPCKDGISHNDIEDAKSEHLEAGCNVLLHAMLARAGAVG